MARHRFGLEFGALPIFFALALGCGAPNARATDYTVSLGSSIQVAINLAQNGDRILVQPGVYNEALDFLGKRLELIGVAGRAVTVIDASGLGKPVVHLPRPAIGNPGSRIAGFTIRGGVSKNLNFGSSSLVFKSGGGINVEYATDPIIEDCEIAYNTSLGRGGGVLSNDYGNNDYSAIVTLRNCEIHHNTSASSGGGVSGQAILEDCYVHHNTSQGGSGGGFYAYAGWQPYSTSPTQATRCVFEDNISKGSGGGVFGSRCTLLDCRFEDNTSLEGSGGGASLVQGYSTIFGGVLEAGHIERCQFYRNTAIKGGGAYSEALYLNSCMFAANIATITDGAYLRTGQPWEAMTVQGCTFFQDGVTFEPAGANHKMIGSIVRQNPTAVTGITNVSYCNIEGGNFPGTGNIDIDPKFVNESTLDLRLQPTSPCIDAGPLGLENVWYDFELQPRKLGSHVDIGADEIHKDCDSDGILDFQEILAGAPDCNGNLIPDSCEIANGTSQDIDHNGVPDECFGVLVVPTQFATIQAAIQSAQEHATILVEDGVYSGNGNVNLDLLGKQISLRSRNGPTRCVIQGGGNSRAIQFDAASENASTIIHGFTFRGFSQQQGAAIRCIMSSAPTIENCIFLGNTATNLGGAVHVASAAHPRFVRCLFLRNTAPIGAAISASAAAVTLDQCTVTGNISSGSAIGLTTSGANSMSNCIVWGNAVLAGSLIALDGTSSLDVDHSDVQGGLLSISQGSGVLVYHASNFDLDPRFVDPAIHDVHLRATSPCRDVGAGGAAKDFEGDAVLGPTDVGADEFATHLYSTGTKTPGGSLTIQLISTPGSAPQLLFMSAAALNPAVNTPYGPFQLGLPLLGGFPMVMPVSPADGFTSLTATIPPGISPVALFAQAYVGGLPGQLTNLDVIEIQ